MKRTLGSNVGAFLGALVLLGASLSISAFFACTPAPITQKLTIGAGCTTAADCGDAPVFYCDVNLPGGYCKKDCKGDFDCPPEAICSFMGDTGQCKLKCPLGGQCHTGYVCRPPSSETATLASRPYCDTPAAAVDGGSPADGAAPMDMSKLDGSGGGQGG